MSDMHQKTEDEKHKDIARIDQESKRTHGWYVRVRFKGKTHSKFFSDTKNGGRNLSLQAALDWRDQTEIRLGKIRTDKHIVTVSNTQSGVVGVRCNEELNRFEVSWVNQDGKQGKTSISIRKHGRERAFALACQVRQEKEAERLQSDKISVSSQPYPKYPTNTHLPPSSPNVVAEVQTREPNQRPLDYSGEGGMTTDELLAVLTREYPNGVSFDPMAVRLIRQKVPFGNSQIEDLKALMFQMENGLWFSREMISDDESLLAFERQATEWLMEYGCFSVERLFEEFRGTLCHIATSEICAAFLRHLGFTVSVWGKRGRFCSKPPLSLDESLEAISETIAGWLEEADGTLTLNEIEQALPYLAAGALSGIRAHFLPEVHETEVRGVPCWCSTEAIHLPEDFSEKLTTAVDTLVALDGKVTAAKLEFALNLSYRTRLREEYALLDNDTFMRVCAKHYQGGNNVFPNTKKPSVKTNGWSMPGRRVRNPNTRFRNIGVPIGAELVFAKDSHITCSVLDDSNQVEYDGKSWAISALAVYLLGVSSANGFYHFSYEGEILWDRRLRLEREAKQDKYQAGEMPSTKVQGTESKIIGLEGRPLSLSTWRSFRADGTNPRIAVWARRVENGESVEQIARESGYAVSTMKGMISNFHLYFKVCRLNGIVPERNADV